MRVKFGATGLERQEFTNQEGGHEGQVPSYCALATVAGPTFYIGSDHLDARRWDGPNPRRFAGPANDESRPGTCDTVNPTLLVHGGSHETPAHPAGSTRPDGGHRGRSPPHRYLIPARNLCAARNFQARAHMDRFALDGGLDRLLPSMRQTPPERLFIRARPRRSRPLSSLPSFSPHQFISQVLDLTIDPRSSILSQLEQRSLTASLTYHSLILIPGSFESTTPTQ